jgi:dephospho-CoA kinase
MQGRVFGLTGGIASGKSTVTKLFRRDGVPMVDADEVARAIVAPGMPTLRMLVSTFGAQILLPDGSLDRPRLGSIVFLDQQKRRTLDSIVQGSLVDEIKSQLRSLIKSHPLVGLDAALIIEQRHQDEYRPLVVVAASPEIQLKRIQDRDGFTEEEAKARLAAQLPMEEKVRFADHVIWNNGTKDELFQRAIGVLVKLRNP